MDVVRLYEKVAGRKAKVTRVPAGVLRVMYRLIRPLHPDLSQAMQFSLYNEFRDRPFGISTLVGQVLGALSCHNMCIWLASHHRYRRCHTTNQRPRRQVWVYGVKRIAPA
jgi:hypothetical protein